MKRIVDFSRRDIVTIGLEGDLRLILWAGDGIHEGVTDIERLPGFDVYICLGISPGINANLEYIYKRSAPGIICILDVFNRSQMARFVDIFRGRVSVIDSDYKGNTPTLPVEYYYELLSEGGKAYNMKGINSLRSPFEDVQNALELFAPVLSGEDDERRTWTEEMLQLAKDNRLTVGETWSSPDIKDPYYDHIRSRQEDKIRWNKDRNPIWFDVRKYSEETLNEYWSRLPLYILTVNFEKADIMKMKTKEYLAFNIQRFKTFIYNEVMKLVKNTDDLREYFRTEEFYKIQELYSLCKEYPGVQFGYITDNRTGGRTYGYWIEKNSAL